MSKGFTLLELIIVIGILAILGTVSVLVLNPAQLFAQARDSQRISDLATLSSALSLYLTDTTSPDLDGPGAFVCGANFGTTITGATELYAPVLTEAYAGVRSVGGLGWVPVAFSGMTGESPIATLPIDPTNSTAYNYQYSCGTGTAKTYELNANLESEKFVAKEGTDGGDQLGLYEVGNSLVL